MGARAKTEPPDNWPAGRINIFDGFLAGEEPASTPFSCASVQTTGESILTTVHVASCGERDRILSYLRVRGFLSQRSQQHRFHTLPFIVVRDTRAHTARFTENFLGAYNVR